MVRYIARPAYLIYTRRPVRVGVMGILLRVVVAIGLTVDAYVHWTFAKDMTFVEGGSIGGDTLFRAQAVVAVLAAVLTLVLARWWTYAVAFLVAVSAVFAMLLYFFLDVGSLGPLPDMYDPSWYREKTITLIGEGVAGVAAAWGFLLARRRPGASKDSQDPQDQQMLTER
jgi:hypothetical protein